jgi:hypothetical protein
MTETESQWEADIHRTANGMVKIAIRNSTFGWRDCRVIPGTALTGVRLTEASDCRRIAKHLDVATHGRSSKG